MMFLFPNILSNFCVPTLFKEYYEKHSGEAVGRGQTAPMRHPKVSQSFSLGGLTAVNVGKHSNSLTLSGKLYYIHSPQPEEGSETEKQQGIGAEAG